MLHSKPRKGEFVEYKSIYSGPTMYEIVGWKGHGSKIAILRHVEKNTRTTIIVEFPDGLNNNLTLVERV